MRHSQFVPILAVGRGGPSTTSGFLPAALVLVLALVAAVVAPARTWAYGEDDSADDHSTAHYDLVLAIARCAGFSTADATTIAEADQVTDTLAYGATAFDFTARDGLYKSYFHFPEAGGSVDASGGGPLRRWAAGIGTLTDAAGTLGACTAAGTCCDAAGHCVTRGSLEAIGIWLHAVGDYWSHHACITAGGTDHTHYTAGSPAQAAYCPTSMHNHEWGTRVTTGYNATLQANALTGLATVRDVLVTYATNHHLTSCGTISDADLTSFASAATSAARVTAAQTLFDTCNAACTP